MGVLSFVTFIPLLFGLGALCLPSTNFKAYRNITFVGFSLQLLLSVYLYIAFRSSAEVQWVEQYSWITLALGTVGKVQIEYFLGADGLSIAFIPLSAFVMWIAVLASWNDKKYSKGYFALLALLNTSIMGVFLALDFFLFFLFYELMLLPLYFLIGMWGGARREYAALKFFLYTLFGSVFMLLVMIALCLSAKDPNTGYQTFNLISLSNPNNYLADALLHPHGFGTIFGVSARAIAFVVLFVAFAIKVPVVPLHTWLPDAHVEAPTPISMILAGIMLKVGGYGIMRIAFPLFPEMVKEFADYISLLGIVSILYGGLNALAMSDLKRLVAYSSVSHMGFVLIGLVALNAEGASGAIFQMVSHGLLSSMMFFCVGVLYDRTHHREIGDFKGLATIMPKYTAMVMIAFFASLGMPGFSAFIAELFTILGAFNATQHSQTVPMWVALCMPLGILLSAGYLLWTLQRMFFGDLYLKETSWKDKLQDLNKREMLVLTLLTLSTLLLGLVPSVVFEQINASVLAWIGFFS